MSKFPKTVIGTSMPVDWNEDQYKGKVKDSDRAKWRAEHEWTPEVTKMIKEVNEKEAEGMVKTVAEVAKTTGKESELAIGTGDGARTLRIKPTAQVNDPKNPGSKLTVYGHTTFKQTAIIPSALRKDGGLLNEIQKDFKKRYAK